jgi:hypothetical protein
MKMKIVCILVIALLIATTALPVVGTINIDKNQDVVTSDEPEGFQKPSRRLSKPLLLPPFLLQLVNGDWDYWSSPPNMFTIPDGNVGIGTSNPTSELEVVGNVEADSFTINNVPVGTSTDSYWSEGEDGDIYYNLGNVRVSGTVIASAYSSNSPYRIDAPLGTERVLIDDANDADIGFLNLTSKQYNSIVGTGYSALDIYAGSNAAIRGGRIRFVPNSNGWRPGDIWILSSRDNDNAYTSHVGNINFMHETIDDDSATEVINMIIRGDSGKVGIGTTNPDANLHVKGNLNKQLTGLVGLPSGSPSVTGTGTLFMQELNVGDCVKIGDEIFLVISISSNVELTLDRPIINGVTDAFIFADSDLFHVESGCGASHMIMDKTGNVGIGTINPTAKLDVEGKIRGNAIYSYDYSETGETESTQEVIIAGFSNTIYVQENDIVMVQLSGTFRNEDPAWHATTYMQARKDSGLATALLSPNWICVGGNHWSGGSSIGIYRADADGYLNFQVYWRVSVGKGHYYQCNIVAQVIGKG